MPALVAGICVLMAVQYRRRGWRGISVFTRVFDALRPAMTLLRVITLRRRHSIERCIDVARIGLDRQLLEPARDLVDRLPALTDEVLALTERSLVAPEAECCATHEAAQCHVALDGGELE